MFGLFKKKEKEGCCSTESKPEKEGCCSTESKSEGESCCSTEKPEKVEKEKQDGCCGGGCS